LGEARRVLVAPGLHGDGDAEPGAEVNVEEGAGRVVARGLRPLDHVAEEPLPLVEVEGKPEGDRAEGCPDALYGVV
jgi:hypothetical protein